MATEQLPVDYYDDQDNYGQYQYVSLDEIVNAMMLETQEEDSFLKNTKRSKILYHAKEGVRNFSRDTANKVKGFEITVPESLVWPLPQDYVNYADISVVVKDEITGSYRLKPLDINYNIHSSIGYLQDNQGDILFDMDGNILEADSLNAIAHPYKSYQFMPGCFGGNPLVDTSKFSKNGEFTIDQEQIMFSSNLSDKEVVIRYVSDGLEGELWAEKVTVHKYLKEALEDYIYYECICRKRNVPMNEKQRANGKYKAAKHKAKMAMADFDMLLISRVMRTAQKLL